jgi:hypothetical protein
VAKVSFNPLVKWFRGRIGDLVFRRAHNGKVSVYITPDMTEVKRTTAQKNQNRRFGAASTYASAAIADPEIRAIYVQMAIEKGRDPKRPFEVAQSDFQHGNDLLWKKHMGEAEKPENWDIRRYPWYRQKSPHLRKRKRRK